MSKLKLMSVTEVGYYDTYASIEGDRYYNYLHMKGATWWLRTRYTATSDRPYDIELRGAVDANPYNTNRVLAPVIRLG